MRKKIKIFKGAAFVIDKDSDMQITTNTGEIVDEVDATGENIKKYIKDKKYPEFKKK